QLTLIERDAGYPLSGNHLHIAVCVCHRIIRRGELAGELIRRVSQSVGGVGKPLAGLVLGARLDSLAARAGNILKKTPSLDGASDVDDVIRCVGAKQSGFPLELAAKEQRTAPQAAFEGSGNDLLQRRVRHQKIFEETGFGRTGASLLERR